MWVQPFEDTRQKFDIKYYLVAILFIIFDLEIVTLFSLSQIFSLMALIWVSIFIFVLTLGFIYEWIKGALKWS